MKRGQRKTAIGIVTSDKMRKTITVETERRVMHPRFKKYIRAYTRYKAHDEDDTARQGDQVLIMETRPLSKTKRWRLVEILRRAKGAEVHETEPQAAAPVVDQPAPAPQPQPTQGGEGEAPSGDSQGAAPQ